MLHLGPAQVEIAIFEPQVFARQLLAAGLKRRRQALVQHLQLRGPNLDLAGRELGVDGSFGPRATLPVTEMTNSLPQRAGQFLVLRRRTPGSKTTCVLP